MVEYENVREALKDMYAISQAKDLKVRTYADPKCKTLINERQATVKDMQEMMFEFTASVADLLGMEEIYLD